MIGGYLACALLAASGFVGAVMPQWILPVIDTALPPGRALAEFRISYGGLAALGIAGLVAGESTVFAAVGVLWLGAAAIRLIAVPLDRPRTGLTYWAFLVFELGIGLAALLNGA